MEFLYLETLPMMIELECYYSAAKIQSKSTQVNNQPHFNKKTSIETIRFTRPNFSQGKNKQLTKVTNILQVASSHLCGIGK